MTSLDQAYNVNGLLGKLKCKNHDFKFLSVDQAPNGNSNFKCAKCGDEKTQNNRHPTQFERYDKYDYSEKNVYSCKINKLSKPYNTSTNGIGLKCSVCGDYGKSIGQMLGPFVCSDCCKFENYQ